MVPCRQSHLRAFNGFCYFLTVAGKGRERKCAQGEAFGQLVPLGFGIAAFAPAAYQRGSLPRPSKGGLISGRVSRLDAFSAYPCPTWLPGGAAGATTGTPEVGPARSSRTKARSPQATNAHHR